MCQKIWTRTILHAYFLGQNCLGTSKLYTTDALKALLCKNRFYFFISFSDTQKLHHLLGCHAIGINSSRILLYKCFPFFKFNMPIQASDNILDKNAVLIRLKIKVNCLTKKLFWLQKKFKTICLTNKLSWVVIKIIVFL